MKIQRRDFLKTSLAVSATAALTGRVAAAGASAATGREYYELRAYRLKPGASTDTLHAYLEKAALPALAQRGIKDVGVFTELEIDKATATSKPKADAPVWVLIPHSTFESFVDVATTLNADATVQKAGASYLDVPKASPSFDRIDTWLYLAFEGMTRHEVPEFSRKKVATRVFEMRDYESHSELKALSKMAMFNAGEIPVMKDLGMSPVFFGQSLAGPNLPHLRYITSGVDLATHLGNWKKFGPDPRWKALSADARYKDNTSKNTSRFLAPTAYSAI